jgi:hypothetical protein
VGLIKGNMPLTRYRLVDDAEIPERVIFADRLKSRPFIDIEQAFQETECWGWVEALDPLKSNFDLNDLAFGDWLVFALRWDQRKVPGAVFNRYLTIALKNFEGVISLEVRREIKERVRRELHERQPVRTDVFHVIVNPNTDEVWLLGTGNGVRERFEDFWRKTFGFGLVLMIPFVAARQHIEIETLEQATATHFNF